MRQHLHNRVARQECTNSGRHVAWRLNFVEWCLILVDAHGGTCFTSRFWRQEFWGGS
jgi:hypothetical protein